MFQRDDGISNTSAASQSQASSSNSLRNDGVSVEREKQSVSEMLEPNSSKEIAVKVQDAVDPVHISLAVPPVQSGNSPSEPDSASTSQSTYDTPADSSDSNLNAIQPNTMTTVLPGLVPSRPPPAPHWVSQSSLMFEANGHPSPPQSPPALHPSYSPAMNGQTMELPLPQSTSPHSGFIFSAAAHSSPSQDPPWFLQPKFWIKIALILAVATAMVAFVRYLLPVLIKKVILPLLDGLRDNVSRPVLALVVVGSEALLPLFFLPTSPPGWLAGIVFRWGWGFLLVTVGTTIGMTLPFLVTRLFLMRFVESILDKRPKTAALVKLPGEGDFWHQFKMMFLLRFSPVPYQCLNYLSAATNVKYLPYIFASVIAQIPGSFLDLYTGIALKNIADYISGRTRPTVVQTIANFSGIALSIIALVAISIYCRRLLRSIAQEEQRMQEEMSQRSELRVEAAEERRASGTSQQQTDR